MNMADTSQHFRVSRPNREFTWDDKPRSLKELLQTLKQPFTLKLLTGKIEKYIPSRPRLAKKNGNQEEDVFHILETRKHKIVEARRMQWERDANDYVVTENRLEIPSSFKGWFEVLPEDGRAVEYFDTIQAITNINPRRFLVRTSTVGYQLSLENGVSSWMAYEVLPGEVLTSGIVFMDQKKKAKGFIKRMLKVGKHTKRDQDLKYLQCFDSNCREIMIPLIMNGVFSPIGDSIEMNYDAIYELADIVSAFSLPVNARLVHCEPTQRQLLPGGRIQICATRDTEFAVVARFPLNPATDKTYEIPIDAELTFLQDNSRKRKTASDKESSNDSVVLKSTVDLPIRIKDIKRTKGPNLFDKLSIRAKARKQRASFKALQEQGVFSSRLSNKSEVGFDMNKDLDASECDTSNNNKETENSTNNTQYETEKSESKIEQDIRNNYTIVRKTQTDPIQERDLPPIPKESEQTTSTGRRYYLRDPLYDELPIAPKPPIHHTLESHHRHHEDDDGYMTPAQVRLHQYGRECDTVIQKKPPVAPRPPTRTKSHSGRLDVTPDYHDGYAAQEMFVKHPEYANAMSHGTLRMNKQFKCNGIHKSFSVSGTEQHGDFESVSSFTTDWTRLKSRSQRNVPLDSNATLRSHNTRKVPTALELFEFSDSLRDIRQSIEKSSSRLNTSSPVPEHDFYNNGRFGFFQDSIDPGVSRNYAYSDPGYKRYNRSMSAVGLNDFCLKQGDDSAISLGSRDYGFAADSENSYSEFQECRDDGWLPPSDIAALTVPEVSKSLRYIGMKDRVVIRFAHEQIDGNMLCTLDTKLLKEGFPELNALELKKIVDFIGGWRPRK